MKILTDIQLSNILTAFVSRIGSDKLEAIAKAQKDSEYACLNYGSSSQIDRQKNLDYTVALAVDSIKAYDQALLCQIIGGLTQ